MTPTTWLNLYLQIYCSNDYKKCQLELNNQNNFHFPQYSAFQFVRASHLIDLFSMDPGFLRFSYSIIAAGAMYYIFGKEIATTVSGNLLINYSYCIHAYILYICVCIISERFDLDQRSLQVINGSSWKLA